MPDSSRCFTRRLLLFGMVTLLLALLFWLGYDLGRGGTLSTAGMQIFNLNLQRLDLQRELDEVEARLQDSERQRRLLERSQQIDLESTRILKEQLRQALDDRVSLAREMSYLKRLIREGGKGAVQVTGFRVSAGSVERVFRYSFTAAQVVSGLAKAQGRIRLRLEGLENGEAAAFSLDELPAADPRKLDMDFEHLQNLAGEFELPEGFEPKTVVIDVEPAGGQLVPSSATFPWVVGPR
ncbi:DUF6776 family protein [Imhoffiella purpurea]|uniref:Uncharacterized protein n=1 Tax=Imhoffiella purpurea TaxID=1249627 RepID=W9VTY7_9GAMM|nr:DUF6776 family protein [Imhoffiella purpurea]EXJ13810.1 hypothetical protein D779_3253 [Imhoffiella purpurea]